MRSIRQKNSRRLETHVDSEGSWAISYGDMITLLLSFFVLYFTVDHDKTQAKQLHQSLRNQLIEVGVAENKAQQNKLNIGKEEGSDIDKRVLAQLGGHATEVGEQIVIDFQDTSFYQLGKVEVNTAGEQALIQFAKMFTPFSGQFDLSIRAYTDTRQVLLNANRFKDNLELSALRSVAAMRVLQKGGIPLDRMRLAGFGELKVVEQALKRVPAGSDPLALSRKVVLVIEPRREM